MFALVLWVGPLAVPSDVWAGADDAELADTCRALAKGPRSAALCGSLRQKFASETDADWKARLGVLDCLLAREQGDKGRASSTQAYLRKQHPFHPDLKFLSSQYTAALCTKCEGRGYEIDAAGGRYRCIPCQKGGRIHSAEQHKSVLETLLKRIGTGNLELEPRRQKSMLEVLNLADKQAGLYLAAESDESRTTARRIAIEALAAYARTSRIALTARIEAVGVDGAGQGRIKIGPYSMLGDHGLSDDNLTLTPARWLRVKMGIAESHELVVGDDVTVVAVPRYYSGRIVGDDLHADEQLLLVIRPKREVQLFGSFSTRRYRCRIGDRWFDDPF